MIQVFIDGSNLWATTMRLGVNIDYSKLRAYFGDDLLRITYYSAIIQEEEEKGNSKIRPLLDWLDYHGYNVSTKKTKSFQQLDGSLKVKGNMDVELAVDMVEAARHGERIWLFSGDGDFTYAVKTCQRKGAFVTVCSEHEDANLCADELRRSADKYVRLRELPIFNTDRTSKWSV